MARLAGMVATMSGRRGAKVYGTREWGAVRRRVLQAARWRCRRCRRYANEVHHIKALADGGAPFDPRNLEAVCSACHRKEHDGGGPVAQGRAEYRELIQSRAD